MPDTQSINQNPAPDVLPNFRSIGVILRVVLWVNGMALLAACALALSWADVLPRMMFISSLLQPVLLVCLLVLFALQPMLTRLRYGHGVGVVILLTPLLTLAVYRLGGELYIPALGDATYHLWRVLFLAAVSATLLLAYLHLRAKALSPALLAARLQALQARIRPHFLFNTINAVLGIVRADPKRAEQALEDMSDLFRMAMKHDGGLVPVRVEMTLARQYLALEQLRLGERLRVNWHIGELPDDALLPQLVLQPLLENAVYHGIEPLAQGGNIDIRLYRSGTDLHLEMYNPCQEQGKHHTGNKMALSNIRERLALQFDIEAHYTVETGQDFYRVHIKLPYLSENAA